jgi:methylthioribulose-1-phosphate dehydratase
MSAAPAQEPFNDHSLVATAAHDPLHPARLISDLCANFYRLGWVTGTGGGISIREAYAHPLTPTRNCSSPAVMPVKRSS